jgi:hypothetical protein
MSRGAKVGMILALFVAVYTGVVFGLGKWNNLWSTKHTIKPYSPARLVAATNTMPEGMVVYKLDQFEKPRAVGISGRIVDGKANRKEWTGYLIEKVTK